jgi:response regulator RpfG family c-di-GMP phosphodiesterase
MHRLYGRQIAAGLLSAGLLAGTTILVWLSGGASSVAVNFYYVPIIISAVAFGDLGAILCAVAAAFLCGPYMPRSWPEMWPNEGDPVTQSFFEIGLRVLFFFIVGVIVSRLTEQARRRASEFESLYRIALAVNSSVRLDRVLKLIVESVRRILRVRAVAIRLRVEDGSDTEALSPPICDGLSPSYVAKGPVNLVESPVDQKAMEGDTTQIRDVASSDLTQYPEELIAEGIRSLLCIPLVAKGKTMGVFRIYHGEPHVHSKEELRLVRAFVEEAAVAIENAGLFEELQASYYETVRSLTRTIEARDPDQLGHAERVTQVAQEIAEEIGLTREDIEMLSFGATLHDVGKVGAMEMPVSTIDFGDADESDDPVAQLHPYVGASILEPVKFLRPVLSVVRCHHENWDGTGYPEGLAGEDIPLYGRIGRIANAYDRFVQRSGATHDAPPIEEAIEHFRAGAGKEYDPELVKVMVRLLNRRRKLDRSVQDEDAEGAEEPAEEQAPAPETGT